MEVVGQIGSRKLMKKLEHQFPAIVLAIVTSATSCICLRVIRERSAPPKCDIRKFFIDKGGVWRPTKKGVRITRENLSLMYCATRVQVKANGAEAKEAKESGKLNSVNQKCGAGQKRQPKGEKGKYRKRVIEL